MATTLQNPLFSILIISLSLSSILHPVTGESVDDSVDQLLSKPNQNKKPLKHKLSHFELYWHDIVSGGNPNTSVTIIQPPINSTTGFGMVNMIDNPLTLRPNLTSQHVGRAQGFYGMASQEEISLIMVMNFVFNYGKYNGSTLTILGSNTISNEVREMSVIGGTGLFRFAHGYAQARTKWSDNNRNAIVKYDLHVWHY